VGKSLKDWLTEGEELYSAALREYQTLEAQLQELEAQLSAKKEELNQIATVIGKPPMNDVRKPAATVQIIDSHPATPPPASRSTIAKALTGRGIG
jgi:hypothetical protein